RAATRPSPFTSLAPLTRAPGFPGFLRAGQPIRQGPRGRQSPCGSLAARRPKGPGRSARRLTTSRAVAGGSLTRSRASERGPGKPCERAGHSSTSLSPPLSRSRASRLLLVVPELLPRLHAPLPARLLLGRLPGARAEVLAVVVEQRLLAAQGLLAAGLGARVGPVGQEPPRLLVVRERQLERLGEDARAQALVEDREAHLEAPEEVALHPVGARAQELLLAAGEEVVDARVLEEAPDDRAHPDVVGHAADPWPEAADAAHEQIDLDARLRGLVERLDDA